MKLEIQLCLPLVTLLYAQAHKLQRGLRLTTIKNFHANV